MKIILRRHLTVVIITATVCVILWNTSILYERKSYFMNINGMKGKVFPKSTLETLTHVSTTQFAKITKKMGDNISKKYYESTKGMKGIVFQKSTLESFTHVSTTQFAKISKKMGDNISKKNYESTKLPLTFPDEKSFEGFDNETGVDEFIVPNIIHFLRFQKAKFSFVDAVVVLAAFKNHRPDKIMFHTDVTFVGKHWEKVKNTEGLIYEIVNVTVPDTIYGQKFSKGWHLWHAGDVTRIRILRKYGGIFLDNDSYLVRSLDPFRKFEIAIAWDDKVCLGTQTIVAHKNARFLRLWLESYKQYFPDQWYYNAGCKPTEEVLYLRPELVHRVKLLFGAHDLTGNLYKTYWKDWRKQYAIHLMIRHRSYADTEHLDKWPVFDENNIRKYNFTFGTMAREAYGIK